MYEGHMGSRALIEVFYTLVIHNNDKEQDQAAIVVLISLSWKAGTPYDVARFLCRKSLAHIQVFKAMRASSTTFARPLDAATQTLLFTCEV